MTHNFINPEVRKEIDNQIPDLDTDAFSIIDDAEGLSSLVYPIVQKRSDNLEETSDNPDGNRAQIQAIIEEILSNGKLVEAIMNTQTIRDKISTVPDLAKFTIISHSILERLEKDGENLIA